MILIVGGLASGRRSYVRSLGFTDADMSHDAGDDCAVLLEAQDLVQDAQSNPHAIAKSLAAHKRVVVCRDVGSGIVPVHADERAWRERAGELSRELAKGADTVVRMTCGIPQFLKGEPAFPEVGDDAHPKAGTSFFTNRACEYFPCHEGIDERDFNCLFCYCPLYALGPDCGGKFTYTKSGRKNCKGCPLPHEGERGASLVAARYEQLAKLASRDSA